MRDVVLCLMFLCLVSVVSAYAQTPLDPMFLSVRSSSALWGGAIITVLCIIAAILIVAALHLGPVVILYVVFFFLASWIIGLGVSGQIGAWVGAP